MKKAGFSLIELVVATAILAVLLSLTASALRGARRRGVELELLTNQREAMRLISLHNVDHQGLFPYFGVPQTNRASFRRDGLALQLHYWHQPHFWALYLDSIGYDFAWVALGPNASPSDFDASDNQARHLLTYTVFATPSYFPKGGRGDVTQHHPQREDAVVYSARKGILRWFTSPLLHPGQPERNGWQVVHFADSHGMVTPVVTLRPGAWDSPDDDEDDRLWSVLATIDGVRGRDY